MAIRQFGGGGGSAGTDGMRERINDNAVVALGAGLIVVKTYAIVNTATLVRKLTLEFDQAAASFINMAIRLISGANTTDLTTFTVAPSGATRPIVEIWLMQNGTTTTSVVAAGYVIAGTQTLVSDIRTPHTGAAALVGGSTWATQDTLSIRAQFGAGSGNLNRVLMEELTITT